MKKKERTRLNNEEQNTRFCLIFSEIEKAADTNALDASLEEIDEIERIRRIVMDVTDESPTFMTST